VKHPDADARLKRYEALVREWADRLDLVSPGDLERFFERHIEDSLTALPLAAEAPQGPAIDVGSGAGLPGVVLAIADPARPWTLLEPRQRRAGFLEEAIRVLELGNCRVIVGRAQDLAVSPDHARRYALALARALGPPERALEMLVPLISSDGVAGIFVSARQEIPPYAEMWGPGLAIVRGVPHDEGKPGRQ
jgi:16S rRNA (guanine527-N7)-methyltransferase